MKILRIIARLNVGGPARHVVWLNEAFSRADHPSTLVTGSVPENEDSLEWFADEKGLTPVRIKGMSRELSPTDLLSLFKILRIVFRERPDIIHTHTAKAGTLGRLAGFIYRLTSGRPVKMVHTYHGHVFRGYYGALKTRAFLFIERMLARFATDAIIAISELQRREINEGFGIGAKEQFSVIPLGLDLDDLRRTEPRTGFKEALGFEQDTFLFAYSGRLTEIKNLPMLLRSFAELRSRGFTRTGLVIIGDGHLREGLMEEAVRLGIHGSTRFLGTVRNIAECIASVDAVVLSSVNEGTPLSLLEAMSLGKLVISTEVGGVPDILGPMVSVDGEISIHENGIGVPADNEAAMCDALRWSVENPDMKRELEGQASRFVESHYSKERLFSDMKALYRSLLG